MYIERQNSNKKKSLDVPLSANRIQKMNDFMLEKKNTALLLEKQEEEELLDSPHDMLLSEHSKDVLAHWEAPEFEMYERDKKWYIYVTIFLLGIISWAIYSNSPVMAITFILIGMVGYVYMHQEPRVLDFMITLDGVVVGREIFDFDNIESFWIFYEPPHIKILSLKTNSIFLPYVHIPIEGENPTHIRQLLLEFIPEEKQEEGLVQIMERLLRI
jgi:hypothetical protein